MTPKKLWRKRLAAMLRRFRKARGYWPDRETIAAAKRGIAQAIAQGRLPVVEH